MMWIDDEALLEDLRRVVHKLTANESLREDLMQEALIRYWQVQESNPGQTRYWYVHNCRFHLLHYLAAGRSIDSPKRRASQVQPSQEDDEADFVEALPAEDDLVDDVSARDMFMTLSQSLSAREKAVLQWFAEGLGTCEIARRMGISHPMVIKHRRKIASFAKQFLGACQACQRVPCQLSPVNDHGHKARGL